MYTTKDDWEGDSHRFKTEVHYRLYLIPRNNVPTTICVQDFDYLDYDARLILSPDAWETRDEAEEVLMELLPAIAKAMGEIPLGSVEADVRDRAICREVRKRPNADA